jgi:DNA polymerase V
MLNAGIEIDDELIVDRSLDAKHGDIVVALIFMSSALST